MLRKSLYLSLSIIIAGNFFIFTPYILAAPNITNASGTFRGGDLIVISGSNFGSKSPAAPLLWDNFDDGTNGEKISTSSNWTSYFGGSSYSNTSPYSGSLVAHNYVEYGGSTGFSTDYHTFTATDTIYYSYMFRHIGTDYPVGVDKAWRVTGGGSAYNGDGMLALSDGYIFYKDGEDYVYPRDCDEGTGRYFSGYSDYGSSTWTRLQMYAKRSTAGASDGYHWAAVGTHEKTFADIENRPTGYTYQYTQALLGLMHDQGNLELGEYHHMYIDDVYIDNTRARVEICEAPTWGFGANCAPQIPSAWSDTEITVTVNLGSFSSNDTAYLYVVDKDGNVNDSILPITFGQTSNYHYILPPSKARITE